jgi:phosphoribosylformylglycinamidine synthase
MKRGLKACPPKRWKWVSNSQLTSGTWLISYSLNFITHVKRDDIVIAILRIEGTNCEAESYAAFHALGVRPDYVHLNELRAGHKSLHDYHGIFIPGGFSSGDYVRAGAIFAARMKALLMDDLRDFVAAGFPIVGVCNGFQVLIELGMLPALDGISPVPQMTLSINDSSRFECRPTLLRHVRSSPLTARLRPGQLMLIPSAHMEGKLMVTPGLEDQMLQELTDGGQIIFQYVNDKNEVDGYPWNPNGSLHAIAGISNPQGTILGMMPHPERAFHSWQQPDWGTGDGRALFESIIDYIQAL